MGRGPLLQSKLQIFFEKAAVALLTVTILTGCLQEGGGFRAASPLSAASAEEDPMSTTPTSSTTTTTMPRGSDGTGGSGGQPGTHRMNCAGRNYILHAPPGVSTGAPLPLVMFFHGAGDDYNNFGTGVSVLGWFGLADQDNFIVMVPEHRNPNRPSFLSFSGGAVDLVTTEREARSVLDCALEHAGSRYNISRSRIHFTGFSEGGTFSTVAGNAFANEIRSVVGHAGSMPWDSPERRIPVFFIVGTSDRFYGFVQSDAQTWRDAGHTVRTEYVSGVGHSYRLLNQSVSPQTVWNWMKAQ